MDRSTRPDLAALAAQVALAARGEGGAPTPCSIHLNNLKLASPQRIGEKRASDEVLYDVCGRRRSPATLRSFRLGKAPANKGNKYPATPPTEAEVLRMLGTWKKNPAGMRGRCAMVIQYRAGLRVAEVTNLFRHHINFDDGTVFVANGKGGKSRLVGMDPWGFEQIQPWIDYRYERYPDGPLLCIVQGPTRGQRWSTSAVRTEYHKIAKQAGLERRFATHQLRHALACQMAREGLPLHVISAQLGHTNVATTAAYLAGISNEEVVTAIHARRVPGATGEPAVGIPQLDSMLNNAQTIELLKAMLANLEAEAVPA